MQLIQSTTTPSQSTQAQTQNYRLDMNNFNTFNWTNIRSLKVEDCSQEITPLMLFSCQNTLTTLELWGSIPFNTLQTFLSNCTSLCCLILSNLNIIGFPFPSSSVPEIDSIEMSMPMPMPTATATERGVTETLLTKLKLRGNGPLTLHEVNLLDYLTEQVTTHRLKSVSLEENNLLRPLDLLSPTENTNSSIEEAGKIAITKLLTKNSSTIKSLRIERSRVVIGIQLNLQLDEFICSISINVGDGNCSRNRGLDQLLRKQERLKTLIRNLNGVRLIPSSNPDSFYEAIEQCSKNLKTVHIDHVGVVRRLDRELNNDMTVATHDFKIYNQCQLLEYLYVGISNYHRLSRYRLIPGQMINLDCVPVSLKTLFLVFDIIPDSHIQSLVQRLSELVNLRSFSAKGNQEMPFPVHTEWIRVLTQLPKVKYFLLTGCQILDFDNVLAFIQTKPDLQNYIEITPQCCAYSSR